MEQARAFSSSNHNDGTFQYFVVGLSNEYSALHASTVLRQASFVNDALFAINEIYKEENRTGIKVIIVAHSVGGIVARTSMLLSNQPKGCLIKAIIMLSSPNRSPTYSPDASMDLLYKTVNLAWAQSFYNESDACKNQKKKFVPEGKLDANFECPRCTARVPLISITGGEIDGLVEPVSTHLDTISPRPRNGTHQKLTMKIQNSSSLFPFSFISPKFWFNGIMSFTKLFWASPAVNSTNAEVNSSVVGEVVEPSKIAEVNTTTPRSYLESVTIDAWQRDMIPYVSPEHITLRTSQMKNLGFPVDHKAVLWCYELLDSVSVVMKELSTSKHGDLEKILLSYKAKTNKEANRDAAIPVSSLEGLNVIEPLAKLVKRNDSINHFIAAAEDDKYYQIKASSNNFIFYATSDFYASKTSWVIVAYVSIGCFALASPLLRSITGHTLAELRFAVDKKSQYGLEDITDFRVTNIWVLSGMDVYFPVVKLILGAFPKGGIFQITSLGAILGVIVLGIEAYSIFNRNTIQNFTRYSFFIGILMAYGLAIALRIFLLSLIRSVRFFEFLALRVVLFIARWTIWCKPIRRFVKGILKPYVARMYGFLPSSPKTVVFVSILGYIAAFITLWHKHHERMKGPDMEANDSLYFAAISVVTTFWTTVGAIVICIIYPPREPIEKIQVKDDLANRIEKARAESNIDLLRSLLREKSLKEASGVRPDQMKEQIFISRQHSVLMNSLILLYLPALLYSASTWMFAHSLLYEDVRLLGPAVKLLNRFGPDMIMYSLSLAAISIQLLLARIEFSLSPPLELLEEIAGPDSNAFPLLDSRAAMDSLSSSECLHEEGGLYAEYALCSKESLEKIGHMYIGATYRVTSCRCYNDRSLKTSAEWCEFCRCLKCGDKKGMLKDDDSLFRRISRNRFVAHLVNKKPALGTVAVYLALVVIGIVNIHYTRDHMFRLLYITGSVAGFSLLADVFG